MKNINFSKKYVKFGIFTSLSEEINIFDGKNTEKETEVKSLSRKKNQQKSILSSVSVIFPKLFEILMNFLKNFNQDN